MPFISGTYRRRLLLAGVIVALGGCIAFGALLTRLPPRGAGLAPARAQWAARPFTHYRLATVHDGGLTACRQDVEIADERVVAVFANTCSRSPITVTNLFLEVERFGMTIGGKCGPNGCACDGPIDVDVVYDPALGYPRRFEVRSKPERRWQYLGYWRGLALGSGCTLVGFSGPSIEVVAIRPLP
jgi:hypothetical protein